MQIFFESVVLYMIVYCCQCVVSLKHHLVLEDDSRYQVIVSSFGYNIGGRLDVIVQNLTLTPDPNDEETSDGDPQYGFALVKSEQARNPYAERPLEHGYMQSCLLNDPRNQFKFDLMTLALQPQQNKIIVKCSGDGHNFPPIRSLAHNPVKLIEDETPNTSQQHSRNKRAAGVNPVTSYPSQDIRNALTFKKCPKSDDLPVDIEYDAFNRKAYSFNFTMFVGHEQEEGTYYLSFYNCRSITHRSYDTERNEVYTMTRFNFSVLISETNYPENYLSAGKIPLPQMYFMLSVMFLLSGCVWVNFIQRQKEYALKIHNLMTVLVFAKAFSLLFHGINYHYISLYGQPVVTWAYLYYATRSVKGALFFITLALIGSGWTFVKHIISPREKKIILMIVALQVIAHVAEIIHDQSTEGEASLEFWDELCGLVDLFSCIVILIPITWSVRHLEEASRTDGKAAQNLKKMELFKRFYIISTVYIYVTRIMTFVLLSMLVYKYSWLSELFSEFATLVYLVITGYYFQPMPTNPYLLLSTEQDNQEDILFSVDAPELNEDGWNSGDEGDRLKNRRIVEDFV